MSQVVDATASSTHAVRRELAGVALGEYERAWHGTVDRTAADWPPGIFCMRRVSFATGEREVRTMRCVRYYYTRHAAAIRSDHWRLGRVLYLTTRSSAERPTCELVLKDELK